MNTKELYLRANALAPLEQNEFFDRLGNCLCYLKNLYPLSLLTGGDELRVPGSLREDINLNPAYFSALLRGILAEGSGTALDRATFVEEAERAYLSLWRQAAKGRQIANYRTGGDA